MMLTEQEIRTQQGAGTIEIEAFDPARLNAGGYPLRLAPELLLYWEVVLTTQGQNRKRRMMIPQEGVVLRPGRVYLARTLEHTRTQGYLSQVTGLPALEQLGLSVRGTAEPDGVWTLAISCVQPVRLYPGMEIGQIRYQLPLGASLPR